MSDDRTAIAILEAVKTLAAAQYPFPDGSDIHPMRAGALGLIRASAGTALDDPPRLPFGHELRANEREACARELEAMARQQESNDTDHGRSMVGTLLMAAECLRKGARR